MHEKHVCTLYTTASLIYPLSDADRYQVYTIAHEYQVKKICDECEKFFIKSMEDERNELMSGLDRFGALGKAFSMLDFAKNFSNDKIVFSAYELISAFPTRHIIQHPSFTVLSDADKVKVLKYRLARTDHPGIIEPIHLTVPSYFTDL